MGLSGMSSTAESCDCAAAAAADDKHDNYCGFVCGEITEKQQEIVDEIAGLRKVNPEFAAEFTGKMVELLLQGDKPAKS